MWSREPVNCFRLKSARQVPVAAGRRALSKAFGAGRQGRLLSFQPLHNIEKT